MLLGLCEVHSRRKRKVQQQTKEKGAAADERKRLSCRRKKKVQTGENGKGCNYGIYQFYIFICIFSSVHRGIPHFVADSKETEKEALKAL